MAQDNPDKKPVRPASIHAGHRQRTKERFLKYGGEQMEEHQLLELILFYAIPQGDVNPLAHRLINRFGSLREVLDADPEELKQIAGISSHTAALLRLFPEVAARYQQADALSSTAIIRNAADAAEIFSSCFVGARVEKVYMISTDAKSKMLGCDLIAQGAADAVLMDSRKVVRTALSRNAWQVFLAHCHVSGVAAPSAADRQVTARLQQALALLGIRLSDHLIFADGDYVSLLQSGLMEDWH
ncbi:MAG: DNA repair protein RadC [Clostridiales bacterium]|nr:DNA repair protein RadC [Clostridiales bacterium]